MVQSLLDGSKEPFFLFLKEVLRNLYKVNPVRNSSRCDSKPSGSSNPPELLAEQGALFVRVKGIS
jgi:hypothetical protein